VCRRRGIEDPKSLDHPLRTDSDVLGKQSLQVPQTHPRVIRQLLSADDVVSCLSHRDQSSDFTTRWIRLGIGLSQVRLACPHHLADVGGREDPGGSRSIVIAENVISGLDGPRDRSDTPLEEWAKPAGVEGGAENVAGTGQSPEELLARDAVDEQPPLLGGDVHEGLRDDLLPVRLLNLPPD
jgi:hypothetical protein